MNLPKAQALAEKLLQDHGLKRWKFGFDRAKVRFGCCRYHDRTITLSKHLTELNDEATVKNTLLHEIAHALVGRRHNHNHIWQAKAREIGCCGNRCYHHGNVITPPKKYTVICDHCQKTFSAQRRRKAVACRSCCKTHNRGRYSRRFLLRFEENRG